jgi:hypothetical protein
MKWLPVGLAGAHALLVVLIFGSAYVAPERNGLAPVLLLFIDFPCSVLIEAFRKFLDADVAYLQRLLIDAVAYLILGSCWFYAIGLLIRQAVLRLRG